MHFEDAFLEAGSFGRVQKWIVLTCIIIHCYSGWPFMLPFLVTEDVPFRCLQPPVEISTSELNTPPSGNGINTQEFSKQEQMRIRRNANSTKPESSQSELQSKIKSEASLEQKKEPECCSNRQYSKDPSYSVISSFDLGCHPNKDILLFICKYAFAAGFTISCLVTGLMGDILGRRALLIPSIVLSMVSITAIPFTPDVRFYIMCQTLLGFFQYPALSQSLLICIENCTSKHVARIAITLSVSSSIGYVIAAVVSMHIPSWKQQILIMAIPQALILVLSAAKMTESTRWMFYTGQYKRTEIFLKNIATSNGKNAGRIQITGRVRNLATLYKEESNEGLLSDEDADLDDAQDTEAMLNSKHSASTKGGSDKMLPTANCCKLVGSFRSALLIIFHVLAWITSYFMWYQVCMLHYKAMDWNWTKFILSLALVKFSSWYVCLVVDAIGRKITLFAFMFTATLLYSFTAFIQNRVLDIVFSVLTFFCLELCYGSLNVLMVYSLEQLPTQLRSTGFSLFMVFGQIALWASPIMCFLNYSLTLLQAVGISAGLAYFTIMFGLRIAINTNISRQMPQTIHQFYLLAKGKEQNPHKESERP